MQRISKLLFVLLLSATHTLTLSAIELSNGAPATSSEQLVELFTTEENPGEGILEYKTATENEKISLGKEGGVFGLGMIFKGKILPEAYRKDFNKNTIIQVALGSLKSKLPSRLPQFGTATLIAEQMPKVPTVFKFIVPENKKPKTIKNTAFLLFTSPTTKPTQSDEEKLKTTYFAKSGTLVLTPVDKATVISVKTADSKISFKRQKMRAEFDAVLATPFNGVERELKGTVYFPFYWPHGKAAEQLASRISGAAMPGAPSASRGLTNESQPK